MNKFDGFLGLAAALCVALLIGVLIGSNLERRYMNQEIARHGFGAYKANSVTGNVIFEWKESAK